ncbi:MAG: bifunctional deaminase-reductase domain protein [Solirubrobacterales bacterium]|nr:bifunctional deaminase-reductase domain protein [Solirubrobacterales bacterium]
MQKYVATTTLDELDWNNSSVIEGDVAAGVAKLKQEDGGPLLVAGSRTLVHTLMENDLIDELRLMVFPLVLGSGDRLFPDSADKTVLGLADTKTFASGVQVQSYRPAGRP